MRALVVAEADALVAAAAGATRIRRALLVERRAGRQDHVAERQRGARTPGVIDEREREVGYPHLCAERQCGDAGDQPEQRRRAGPEDAEREQQTGHRGIHRSASVSRKSVSPYHRRLSAPSPSATLAAAEGEPRAMSNEPYEPHLPDPEMTRL